MTMTVETLERTPLARVVQESGLEMSACDQLVATFEAFRDKVGPLEREAAALTVTDATQVTEIRRSRELRLQLRAVRTDTENTRKKLKEDSLRTGKLIDGMANVIKGIIEPIENRLYEQERFAENKEAERKANLEAVRAEALRPYVLPTEPAFNRLCDMTEEQFAATLDGARLRHENRIAAEAKAKAEREAAEKARAEEEARVRAENARLKLEADAREAEMRKQHEANLERSRAAKEAADAQRRAIEEKASAERAAHELVLKAERDARAKLEADAAEVRAKEARRVAAEKRAAKKAAMAPDKDKILALAASITAIPMPSVASEEAQRLVAEISSKCVKFAAWVSQQADALA